MREIVLALVLCCVSVPAWPQAPAAFEVASVKLAQPQTGTAAFFAMDSDPAMVRYSNVTLKNLISVAYGFDSPLVTGGPEWLDEQFYGLSAKLPPGTPKDRVPAMLRALLSERFNLSVHREMKVQRVYFLVLGKNGPKLKEVPKTDSGQEAEQVRGESPAVRVFRGGIFGKSMLIGTLAGSLSFVAGCQVVDRTGLAGTFDISLKWTPEDGEDSNQPGPSLFTAIQEQLGLKLEPGRAPVEMLVVDHAKRIPTEN